ARLGRGLDVKPAGQGRAAKWPARAAGVARIGARTHRTLARRDFSVGAPAIAGYFRWTKPRRWWSPSNRLGIAWPPSSKACCHDPGPPANATDRRRLPTLCYVDPSSIRRFVRSFVQG